MAQMRLLNNRTMKYIGFVALAACVSFPPSANAQTSAPAAEKPSIAGGWTLNKELSDPDRGSTDRGNGDTGGSGRRGGGGGGYGGGGFGGGGFGGGGRRRGGGMGRGGGQGQQMNPDDAARMRDAIRDITAAQDHLTITQTDSMIVVTSQDGRTTRLSADGKKVKDDNTKIERKTKWDAGKLTSEISGAGPGKMTQTFFVDPETHKLRITVQMEARGKNTQARSITHVYDPDAQ
jgi:hypothetical protein